MAQTTTMVNACDVSVWLDNAAGTLKDVSGSSNVLGMKFDMDIGEFKAFQSRWKARVECGKDAEFKLTAVYSETTDEALSILKNWFFAAAPGARSLKIYIPDKNVGSDLYSCEVRLKDLEIPADASKADPIMVSATLVPDGAVTLTTNAT